MRKVQVKVFRVMHRTDTNRYEEKINEFLKNKIFIDMKVVGSSSDHAFDVIVIYQDGEEQNV